MSFEIRCGYYRDWRRRKIQRFPRDLTIEIDGRVVASAHWEERPGDGTRNRRVSEKLGKPFSLAELMAARARGEIQVAVPAG